MDIETLKILAELLHGGGSAILLVVAWVALRAGRAVADALATLKRIEENQRKSIEASERTSERQESKLDTLQSTLSTLPLKVAGVVSGRTRT
jgi:hypothetical protein